MLVPNGAFLTGTLRMKSNVNLHLEPTALLLGSTNIADYATDIAGWGFPGHGAHDSCLIYGEHVDNVTLSGSGTIDGQGGKIEAARPMLIRFYESTNLTIRDLNLKHAGAWCVHFNKCIGIRATGVNIDNRHFGGGNDGFDFMSSRDIRVSDCIIICGDDAICFQPLDDDYPCGDAVITNCIMSTRWSAIRSGGDHGAIRNITVSNCLFRDIWGCGIKMQISGNAIMENLTFSNIVMHNVSAPISLRFGNHHYGGAPRDESKPWGTMRNIMFNNIYANIVTEEKLQQELGGSPHGEEKQGITICGIPGHPVEGVTMSNMHIVFPGGGTKEDAANVNSVELEDVYPEYFMWGVIPAYGLYARHARALSMDNVRFELASKDVRPPILCDDVADLQIDGLRADISDEAPSFVRLRNAREVFMSNCRRLGPSPKSKPDTSEF